MTAPAGDFPEVMRVVRPYMVTGGRTRPAGGPLPVEALIEHPGGALPPELRLERRSIVELCVRRTLSVAEIAAHLKLPLGVVRVLVADLATAKVLIVHDGSLTANSSAANLDLLASVLDGISKL